MCMSLAAPQKVIQRKNKALMLILSRTQVNQFYFYLSIEFKYEIFRKLINLST